MKIIKYILLPFVMLLNFLNYQVHLEDYRFDQEHYKPYKIPAWINKFYKSLKKGE